MNCGSPRELASVAVLWENRSGRLRFSWDPQWGSPGELILWNSTLVSNRESIFREVWFLWNCVQETLAKQKEELETSLTDLYTTCEFVEKALEHGSETEVLLVKKQVGCLADVNCYKPRGLSDIAGMHKNFTLLVSHFKASICALNRRRGDTHKWGRMTVLILNTSQQCLRFLLCTALMQGCLLRLNERLYFFINFTLFSNFL